jgi:hypothetical protein
VVGDRQATFQAGMDGAFSRSNAVRSAVRCAESPAGGSGDLVDTDGQARAAYVPSIGELVAVRPDGYVGARGDEAAVGAFLKGVLPPA